MKRWVSLIIALLLALTSLAAGAFAAPAGAELVCAASAAEAEPGGEVTVTLALQNAGAAKSIALLFDYDIQTCFEAPQDSDGAWKLTGALLASFDTSKVACGAAAIAYASEQNMNRELFTLTLRLRDDAPSGETTITVTPTVKNGTATIVCQPATLRLTVKSAAAAERGTEYRIDGIRLRDANFNEISAFPKGRLFAEVEVTNLSSTVTDMLLLASYDRNGRMLGLSYLFSNPQVGQSVTLGTSLDNTSGEIARLKAFMLSDFNGGVPLAEAVELVRQ